MKKVSILIALALLLTVGGVYATWIYAGAPTTSRTNDHTAIGITGSAATNTKGVISITNTIEILIDDDAFVRPGVGDAYKAVFVGNGQMTVTFTPSSGADAAVVANGIKMKATLALEGCNANALKLGTTELTLNPENSGAATKSDTITADEIIACLTLNNGSDLILDTLAKYENFKTSLGTPRLVITISEVE